MQVKRLPVPDSPHKMLIYSSGNCSLLICPTRKTLICHYSTVFYSSSLSPQTHSPSISLCFSLSTSFFFHSLSLFLAQSKKQLVEIMFDIWDANSYCLFLVFNHQNVKGSASFAQQTPFQLLSQIYDTPVFQEHFCFSKEKKKQKGCFYHQNCRIGNMCYSSKFSF